MNRLVESMGSICKMLFPISEDVYLGNRDSPVAICTLSSISLLKELSSSEIINNVSIIGRLLSENKGIDSLIKSITDNPQITTLILCGRDVRGHRAGHSLLALYNNGIDSDGRIIGSTSPEPVLVTTKELVRQFQQQVGIVDKIGQSNSSEIIRLVLS